MKKTITKKDGSTEVVEGTPEEIADYERKIRGEVKESPKNDGPGLLTDQIDRRTQKMDDVIAEGMKKLQELIDAGKFVYPPKEPQRPLTTQPFEDFRRRQYRPHSEYCQMTVASRGWMSIIPPRCDCGSDPFVEKPATFTFDGFEWITSCH
jgi:hypothetical protein